jgi:hypothetical protein
MTNNKIPKYPLYNDNDDTKHEEYEPITPIYYDAENTHDPTKSFSLFDSDQIIYDPANPIYDPATPIYDPETIIYDPTTTTPLFSCDFDQIYDPSSPIFTK